MGNVKVLDCTLRDGGYVNNWEFGENNIQNICEKLEQTNVDIIELGFMRDVNYDPNKSLFRTIEQANHVIRSQKENIIYSALVEMANPYPLELLEQKKEGGVELLRYSFWKRCIDEAYEYASKIREKGYQLGVQPTRVEQYSDEEFGLMCRRFSALKPFAIYIVDTFLVVVFGGAGSLFGTILSAFGISQAQSILEFFISGSMAKVCTLLFVVVVLMFRPQGLIANKIRH